MIEAKLIYRARCNVCREAFGPEVMHTGRVHVCQFMRESDHSIHADIHYTGPYVCPTCTEKQCAPVNGCLDQSLHDNLIGMGIKKEKGEK